jgi:hypothetical protein
VTLRSIAIRTGAIARASTKFKLLLLRLACPSTRSALISPNAGGVGRTVGVGDTRDEGVGFGVAFAVGVTVAAGDGVVVCATVGVAVVVKLGVGVGTPAIKNISSREAGCAPLAAAANDNDRSQRATLCPKP